MDERDEERVDIEEVGRVIALAGARPAVPKEEAERIESAVRRVWEREVRRRRARTWGLASAAALAAAVLLALGLRFVLSTELPVASQPLARVATITGEVLVHGRDGAWAPVERGALLEAGAQLRTSSGGRGALRLTTGASLRLDRVTHVVLERLDRVQLAAGAVYLDSGEASAGLEVSTPFGRALDVGTQFLVRLESDAMRVGVREGAVLVSRGDETYRATAGSEMQVDEEGTVERRELAPFGESWSWILDVAPPFALEGASLESFLSWVASETGWTIRYADPAVAARAATITLHGSIEEFDPASAPAVVLPSVGLQARLEEGVLVVE